jgi:hypothetical protein
MIAGTFASFSTCLEVHAGLAVTGDGLIAAPL